MVNPAERRPMIGAALAIHLVAFVDSVGRCVLLFSFDDLFGQNAMKRHLLRLSSLMGSHSWWQLFVLPK